MSDGGKGDKQRPTNMDKFYFNYDLIFGKNKIKPISDLDLKIGGDGDHIEPITQEKVDEFYKALEPYET